MLWKKHTTKSFVNIIFLTKNNCMEVTENSAQTVPIAAPKAPNFGIKIAFKIMFIVAPTIYEIREIFSFPNAGKICTPIKLPKEIITTMGVIICITGIAGI